MSQRSASANETDAAHAAACFVPDFRNVGVVLVLVLAGTLLAFVLVLFADGVRGDFWMRVASTAFFVQWVSLPSAVGLTVARSVLERMSPLLAGVTALLLVMLVTATVAVAASWLDENLVPLGVSGRSVDRGPGIPSWQQLLPTLVIATITAAVALHYCYVQHEWRRRIELEARARVMALQARIRPHFLFNSMNTIATLTRTDPVLAEQVTLDLADLFRASLDRMSARSTLGDELHIAQQYLRIEGLRLGARLDTAVDDEQLPHDAVVPALLLQPLVENAVYHGVEPAAEGGDVRVSGTVRDGRVELLVTNSLPRDDSTTLRNGNQLAQRSVAAMLRGLFGDSTRFSAEVNRSAEQARYEVRLEFPYRVGDETSLGADPALATLAP